MIANLSIGQNYSFDWVNTLEPASGYVAAQWFAVDDESNIITTGRFKQGSYDFDPGIGVFNMSTSHRTAIHVSKFNTFGDFQWAIKIESNYNNSFTYYGVEIQDLKTNGNGDIYATGYFADTLFYEDKNGSQYAVSNGSFDIFYMKLSSSGVIQWLKTYGDIYDDQGSGISITNSGDIYVTGYFAEYVQFDPSVDTLYGRFYDLFVLKFDSTDMFQWVYSSKFENLYTSIEPSSIEVNEFGDIFITGKYNDYDDEAVDFDPGPDSTFLIDGTGPSGFLMKIDTSGIFQWAKRYSTNSSYGIDLACDAAGNVLLTGYLGSGSIDFDTTSSEGDVTSTNGGSFYLLKLNTAGDFIWVKHFQPAQYTTSQGLQIALDDQEDIYLSGTFDGNIDADPGVGSYLLTKTPGATNDAFITKLDQDGKFVMAEAYGTESSDRGTGIVADDYGNIYGGLNSGYVDGDTMVIGNMTLAFTTANNVSYVYKILRCQKELIHQLDDSTYYADALNASYQWLDCNNGFAPVIDDTNRFFTASVSGNYALEVTNYTCVDTSECVKLQREVFIIDAFADSVCLGVATTFIDSSQTSGTGIVYTWDFDNDGVIDDTTVGNTTFNFPASGSYNAKLVVKNNESLEDSVIFDVLVYSTPSIDAGTDITIDYGESTLLSGLTSVDVVSIEWSPESSLDSKGIVNPLASPLNTTDYRVEVFNAFGCSDQDTIKVTVDFFIPTGFTPDGDGINDIWEIPVLNSISESTVEVFDRAGQKVFAGGSNNYWDGYYNGKESPVGAYYYIIDFKDGSEPVSGNVNLIRVKR